MGEEKRRLSGRKGRAYEGEGKLYRKRKEGKQGEELRVRESEMGREGVR